MFSSGISNESRMVFSLLTFLVAVPSGVKVFNWVATLYKGSIEFCAPLLYVMMFIFLFSIGGLTGLVLGSLATNVHLTDTYFVVAHFHYVMFGGVAIILLLLCVIGFLKCSGKCITRRLQFGQLHLFSLVLICFILPCSYLVIRGCPDDIGVTCQNINLYILFRQ